MGRFLSLTPFGSMISFAEGGFDENTPPSSANLKKLIQAILSNDPFAIGSYHGELNNQNIAEIISYLMYTQNHSSIQIIIDKEANGYHLGLTIDKKEK